MASSPNRTRQYVGLAIIVIAFIGGIIGWSWAALTVEPAETSAAPADSTQAVEQRLYTERDGMPEIADAGPAPQMRSRITLPAV